MKNLLSIAVLALGLASSVGHAGERFDRKLELQGIRFHITSANQGSVNILKITPSGKVTQRKPIKQEVFGTITGAEIADLNADGWPEIYVYVTSAGSGSAGSVAGFAVNRGKSVTPINLPELGDDPVASKGYQGHDEFSVIENSLGRRFPVYKEGDTNAKPTGGKRQLQYRLKAGEAGWLLELDHSKTQQF